MKIFHAGDIHYCAKYLDEVGRCFPFAVQQAIKAGADTAILGGDLFDERLEQNSPALLAAIDAVRTLADAMPVLVLQGTFSHDAPGAINILSRIQAKHPICVVDRICQVALMEDSWEVSKGWAHEEGYPCVLLVSCLPSINKGAIAASVGAENASGAVGELVAKLLAGWGPGNDAARDGGAVTVVVSHGTVNGCETESGVPMAGMDHEFTTGSLFASRASAIMLNHIHKHQSWRTRTDGNGFDQIIAYSGSIGRFHYGETDNKGALLWEVGGSLVEFDRIITPARQYVDLDFPGLPDMAAITKAQVAGAWVRVRYTVDEEHRQSVDRDALRQILLDAGAAEVKVEPTINPIQRQRAAGIGTAPTVADQVRRWCETTNTEPTPVLDRLEQLESAA